MRTLRVVEAGPVGRPRLGPEGTAVLAMTLVLALGGLLLATVWMRHLTGILGGPAGQAPVFAAFLAALAVGVIGPGRAAARHPNPLFIHTSLQAAVTVVALGLPVTLPVVDMFHGGGVNRFSPGPNGLVAWRFLVALLALLPGAGLLGTSIPVLGALLLRDRPGLGGRAGNLVASLAVGAAAGAAGASFLLLPGLGPRGTTFVAVLLLLGGSTLSLALAPVFRGLPAGSTAARDPFTDAEPRLRRAALLAVAATGFTAFVAAAGAERLLGPVLLAAPVPLLFLAAGFLVAHGLGAAILGSAADRARTPEAWLAALTVALPVAVLGALPFASLVPRGVAALGLAPAGPGARDFLLLVPFAAVPGFLIGGVFPLAARIVVPGAPAAGRWSALVTTHLAGILAAVGFAALLFAGDPGSPVPLVAASLVSLLAAVTLFAALPPARRTGPPRLAVLGLLLVLVGLAGAAGPALETGRPATDPSDAALRSLLAEMYLPRIGIVLSDADPVDPRTRLRAGAAPVDAVLLRAAPGTPDPGTALTRDLLVLARDSLAPHGVVVVTLHTDRLPEEAVRGVAGGFLAVFADVHLWSGSPTALVLVGGCRPLRPDFYRLEQAVRTRGDELARAGLAPEAQILAQFVTDRTGLAEFAGEGPGPDPGLALGVRNGAPPVTALDLEPVRRSPIDVLTGYEHRPEIAREAERYARARHLALGVLRGDPLPAGQETAVGALDLALALAEEHLCLAAFQALTAGAPAADEPVPVPPEPRLATAP